MCSWQQCSEQRRKRACGELLTKHSVLLKRCLHECPQRIVFALCRGLRVALAADSLHSRTTRRKARILQSNNNATQPRYRHHSSQFQLNARRRKFRGQGIKSLPRGFVDQFISFPSSRFSIIHCGEKSVRDEGNI